jgi:hypothetical protein
MPPDKNERHGPTRAKVVSTWEACPKAPGPKAYALAAAEAARVLASRGVHRELLRAAVKACVQSITATSLAIAVDHAMGQDALPTARKVVGEHESLNKKLRLPRRELVLRAALIAARG